MAENDIIAEIHGQRAELARRCDYDIYKLMAFYRDCERESEKAGRKLILAPPRDSAAGTSVVREDAADA